MRKLSSSAGVSIALLLFVTLSVAIFLGAADKHTLIFNGESTNVPVIFVSGHPYVGLEALANVINGSVSSSGAMVALTLNISPNPAPSPITSATQAPATAPTQAGSSNAGFSQGFLNAGIEQMSTLREWHTALQTAIQSGIPLSTGLLQPYRAQAATNLRLAEVAAKTSADRNAYQLLNNEFQNMSKLSDKYINKRADMTYISPNALQNDALNQQIISCGHSLGAMVASGQFSDDGSCD